MRGRGTEVVTVLKVCRHLQPGVHPVVSVLLSDGRVLRVVGFDSPSYADKEMLRWLTQMKRRGELVSC